MTATVFDPSGTALVVVLAAGYAAGVRRARHAFGSWPVGRTVSFAAGLLVVAAALDGPAAAGAHTRFTAYAVLLVGLLVVAPMLLAFGRPVALASLTVPAPAGVRRPVGRALRVLANPFVGPLMVPLALAAVLFTPVAGWALSRYAAYTTVNVAVLVAGMLFALPIAGDRGEETSLGLAMALFVGFIEMLLDAGPGLVVWLGGHLLAGGYYLHALPSPGAALHDQQTGGGVLLVLAETLDIPFLAIVVARWVRVDRLETLRVDRELDAARAAARAPDTAGGRQGAAAALDAPWWEQNPDVFGGPRAAAFRRAAAVRRARDSD